MARPATGMDPNRDGGPRLVTEADITSLEQRPYDELVRFTSTYDIFCRGAELHGDRPAILYTETGDPGDPVIETTYRQLLASITRAANLFHRAGVGRGDAVGLLLPNVPEAHIALWGAEAVGRACPINFMLRAEYIVELLEAAGAKVLVALGPDPDLDIWSKVADLKAALPDLNLICQVKGGGEPDAEAPLFGDLLAAENGDGLACERPPVRSDIAAYYHTGGTTGAPKLAQHTHANEVHTSWSASRMYRLGPDDIMLNGFPLFHVAGSFVFGLSAFAACSALLLPGRLGMRNMTFVKNYWRFVERLGVTHLGCVPTVLAGLMNVPTAGADLSSVRAAWSGGSPLPSELAAAFEKQTGVNVRNLFGMTESGGIVSITPVDSERVPGGCGFRLPFTQVRAFRLGSDGGPDMNDPCDPGELGVVALRGPHISPGYSDPARDAGVFTEDGWLISGDLGWVDKTGQVFLTGRVKDLIIRGAHNIDPAMIEEVADQHPAVEICAAVGQPDAYAGELPMLYVTLKPGQTLEPAELLTYLEERVPERPALPKRVEIIDAMPLTAIGKIYKPTLRAQATEHVIREVLKPLTGRGVDGVKGIDEGGRLTTEITLTGDGAVEAEARSLLRDFAIEFRFV